jgi:hypothetical protein
MLVTNLDDERSIRIFCALHKPFPVPTKKELNWFSEVRVGAYSDDSSSQSGYILTDKQIFMDFTIIDDIFHS